ncbi:MAG: ribosomal protein S18-alanine N-acetyltransferase [Aquificaceae bacterium]
MELGPEVELCGESIRPMRREDLPEVLRISGECFNSDAWNRKAFERELELDYSYSFVLEESGKLIGYAVVWKIFEDVNLMSIAISRDYWGKGYGRKLMAFLVEYFRYKAKRFLLDVRKSNIRAIRLYQSLGFKIVSERRKYYSDGEDAFQMLLELEEVKDGNKGKTPEATSFGGEHKEQG